MNYIYPINEMMMYGMVAFILIVVMIKVGDKSD